MFQCRPIPPFVCRTGAFQISVCLCRIRDTTLCISPPAPCTPPQRASYIHRGCRPRWHNVRPAYIYVAGSLVLRLHHLHFFVSGVILLSLMVHRRSCTVQLAQSSPVGSGKRKNVLHSSTSHGHSRQPCDMALRRQTDVFQHRTRIRTWSTYTKHLVVRGVCRRRREVFPSTGVNPAD